MNIEEKLNKINNLLLKIDIELSVFELFKNKEVANIAGKLRQNNLHNFKILENKLNNIT